MSKIFEEYEVACEDCKHYWDDSCDGPPEGKKQPCKTFLATKRVDIPKQIKVLEKRINFLEKGLLTISALTCIFALVVTIRMGW